MDLYKLTTNESLKATNSKQSIWNNWIVYNELDKRKAYLCIKADH